MPPSLMIDRRFLLAGACAAMLRPARAQTSASPADYPAQRIRIFLPESAGDVIDQALRGLLNAMTPNFSEGFQIIQQPALGGAAAARAVAKADPDGYTLLIGTPQTHSIAPELLPQPGYDPMTDFETVCGIGDVPLVLVARRTLVAETLRQLIELSAGQPQRYRYGSPGVGTLGHMAGELFKLRSRTEAVHIPFASETQVMQALVAQQIDYAILPLGAVSATLRLGQVKLFAQLGRSRDTRISTAPTMSEAGVANLTLAGWFGCYAPAKTPATKLDLLAAAIRTAMQAVPMLQLFDRSGLTAALRTVDDMETRVAAERRIFGELIRLKSLKTG